LGRTILKDVKKTIIINNNTNTQNKNGYKTCVDCEGKGIKNILRQLGPGMIQQMQAKCEKCQAKGFIIRKNHRIKEIVEKIKITIEPGTEDGEKLVFKNKGNFNYIQQDNADLIIIVRQLPDKVFERKGKHLFYKKDLNIIEALAGSEFIIKHIDNRELLIKLDNIISNETVKMVRYEGMPIKGNNILKGNLFIVFNLIFPKYLEDDKKEKLKSIFDIKSISNQSEKIPCNLEDPNENNHEEEENEHPMNGHRFPPGFHPGMHPGGPNGENVQCSQQ